MTVEFAVNRDTALWRKKPTIPWFWTVTHHLAKQVNCILLNKGWFQMLLLQGRSYVSQLQWVTTFLLFQILFSSMLMQLSIYLIISSEWKVSHDYLEICFVLSNLLKTHELSVSRIWSFCFLYWHLCCRLWWVNFYLLQDNLLLIYCAQNPNTVNVYPQVVSNPGGEWMQALSTNLVLTSLCKCCRWSVVI